MTTPTDTLIDQVPGPRDEPHHSAEALLQAHVPLTLLIDLASGDPHSDELFAEEGGCFDWIPA